MKKFLLAALVALAAIVGDGGTVFAEGLYLGAGTGQVWHEDSNLGTSTPFYVQAGRDFGMFRAEVEYDRLDGRNDANGIDGHLILARSYVENSYGAVTPYISGAVGYGWLGGNGVADSRHADGLILGAGAGIDYDLSKGWSAVVGYEYLTSTEKTKSETGVNEWQSHNLRVGIRKAI